MIKELDHEEFFIKDRQGLVLLFLAIKLGLNVQGYYIQNFPINMIYRHWTYSEAQVIIFHIYDYYNKLFITICILDVFNSTNVTKF